ncbi:LOW QUALITY PROTEIN: UPF0764 protein C16orf89 homolog [Phoenicopterus ruber ruber]
MTPNISKRRCSNHLSEYYKSIFCASMIEINLEVESNGFSCVFLSHFVPPVALRGTSGFSDFYKLSWLEKILTWQKPQEGCFREPREQALPHRSEVVGYFV